MRFWALLYSAGAIQAGLLSLALWRRRPGEASRSILAGWMALVCLDLLLHVWAYANANAGAFKVMRVASILPFPHAAAFWVYVRSITRGRGLARSDGWHATGFLLGLLLVADPLLADSADIASTIRAFYSDANPSRMLFNLLLFGVCLSYVAAALVEIHRQRRRLLDTRSDSHPDALRWLLIVALFQVVIWAIAVAQWLVPDRLIDYPMIYAAVSAWALVVGYIHLLRTDGGDRRTAVEQAAPMVGDVDVPADVSPADVPLAQADDDARFDAVEARLGELMAVRQIYREPLLGIATLARRSGYPEYLVSLVINRRLGCPFWDYVNRYRVEAVRDRLLDPAEQRTVLDIAYDCGFTSKSTFNAAFRRLLGETPSACRARAGRRPDDADTTP